jgi:hypothetical protein
MQALAPFLPIVIMTVLYASFLKLAAKILRFVGLTWMRAFLFAILIVVLSAVIRVASAYFGAQLPAVPEIVLGVILQLVLGAWSFRSRASNPDGSPIGWLGGAKLCALAVGFLFLMAAGFLLIAQSLLPPA